MDVIETNTVSLNKEITDVEIVNYAKGFDKAIKKKISHDFKRGLFISLDVVISATLFTLFPGPISISISVTLLSTTMIIDRIRENFLNSKAYDSIDKYLEKEIDIDNHSKYYTEEYKQVESQMNYNKSLIDKKEQEHIKKKNKFTLLGKEDIFLNKNETIDALYDDISMYYKAYKLPPLKVDDSEFNTYFDTLYEFYEKGDMQSIFYEDTSKLFRYTFANALVNKNKSIKITDYIDNLYILQDDDINLFTEKNILYLQKNILTKLNEKKVISFDKHKEKVKSK